MQVEEIEELRRMSQDLGKILEALARIDQHLQPLQQQLAQRLAAIGHPTRQVEQSSGPGEPARELERTPQEILKAASEQVGSIRRKVAEYSAQPGLIDRVIAAVREHLSKALESVDQFEDKLNTRRQEKAEARQRKRVQKTLSKMPEIKTLAELQAVLDHLQKKFDSLASQLGQARSQEQPKAVQSDRSPANNGSAAQNGHKPVEAPRVQPDDKLVLIKYGPAPYQFDLRNDPSYFVHVRNPQGAETVLWGKGLEQAIRHAGAKPGDQITVKRTGRTPVEVDAVKRDGAGNAIAVKRIDAHRNRWELAVVHPEPQPRRKPKTQDPPGWREWVKEHHPCTVLPETYREFQAVFPDLAKEFRQSTKHSIEGAALKLREEVAKGAITPLEAAQKLIEQAPANVAASVKIEAREAARAAFESGGSLQKVISQLKAAPEQNHAAAKAVAISR